MKILHLIASVDPEGGGPLEYARVVAEHHRAQGHESGFVTLDAPGAPFIDPLGFPVHTAGPARGGPAGFFQDKAAYATKVAEVAAEYDVAVIHGLWNVATMAGYGALKAAGIPWVIFSHGMLDPYFRKIKPVKHWIKQAFWTLWQGRMVSQAKAVLFTCQEEQRLARNAFAGHQTYTGKVVAFCASDQSLTEAEMAEGARAFRAAAPALGDRPYFLFLSRIHPKKACDVLIKAFAEVADLNPDLDLVFVGPDQTGWVPELKALAEARGITARVHWVGMIQGATKSAAFAEAECFVLPSHQENFGLVVAEALSVGTPVLISDKVNIWREIVEDGAGLAGEDTVVATVDVHRAYLEQPAAARTAMRAAAAPCYQRRFSPEAAAQDLLTTLQEAVA